MMPLQQVSWQKRISLQATMAGKSILSWLPPIDLHMEIVSFLVSKDDSSDTEVESSQSARAATNLTEQIPQGGGTFFEGAMELGVF